jgi:uncharacterized protein YjiS (DUF1127 family)
MSGLVGEGSFPTDRARATGRRALRIILFDCAHTTSVWIERRRQRQALIALDDRLRTDIGLSREQVRREAAKPFWKP